MAAVKPMAAAKVVSLRKRDLVRNTACRWIKAYPVWLFTRGAGKPELSMEFAQIVACKGDRWADLAVPFTGDCDKVYDSTLGHRAVELEE
jgi:hypothetical protein